MSKASEEDHAVKTWESLSPLVENWILALFP